MNLYHTFNFPPDKGEAPELAAFRAKKRRWRKISTVFMQNTEPLAFNTRINAPTSGGLRDWIAAREESGPLCVNYEPYPGLTASEQARSAAEGFAYVCRTRNLQTAHFWGTPTLGWGSPWAEEDMVTKISDLMPCDGMEVYQRWNGDEGKNQGKWNATAEMIKVRGQTRTQFLYFDIASVENVGTLENPEFHHLAPMSLEDIMVPLLPTLHLVRDGFIKPSRLHLVRWNTWGNPWAYPTPPQNIWEGGPETWAELNEIEYAIIDDLTDAIREEAGLPK